MKWLVVISVLCALGSLVGAFDARHSENLHWKLFKGKYNKVYADSGEESMRKSIFLDNKQQIEHHNAHLASKMGFQMGYSHLSDWTPEELQQLNGLKPDDSLESSDRSSAEMPQFIQDILKMDTSDLPKEVDWRQVPGRVSEVKNQGHCGSCWAFATTGVLEGQQYKFNISLTPLSEQNIIDCSKSDHGCNGGLMAYALEDIAREHGIESEQDYPYLDVKGPVAHNCTFKRNKSVMSLRGIHMLPFDERALQKVVATFGPVASGVYVSVNIRNYKSGVFIDPECEDAQPSPNHGILVVGYGTDPKQGDYWLIKNSWGPGWGDQGYFKLARNRARHCSIGKYATIPIF